MIKRLFDLRPVFSFPCFQSLSTEIYRIFYSFFGFSSQKLFSFFFFLLSGTIVFSQDTIPPQIISPARDTSFSCGQNPVLLADLAAWYNAAGHALAQDNSGSYTWEANISLAEAISRFVNSRDTLCGNTQQVMVSFTAIDGAGNRSTPTTARFFTYDDTRPAISAPPNVTVFCSPQIRDTLIRWIRDKGGYTATDLCSNILTWTRFQYSISQGNTIIQTGGGSINNGPYPTIPNGVCQWRMNINFWVEDECGNETVTFGTTSFSVIDNAPPVPVNPLPDITVTDRKSVV